MTDSMKMKLHTLISIVFIAGLFIQCKHESEVCNYYFDNLINKNRGRVAIGPKLDNGTHEVTDTSVVSGVRGYYTFHNNGKIASYTFLTDSSHYSYEASFNKLGHRIKEIGTPIVKYSSQRSKFDSVIVLKIYLFDLYSYFSNVFVTDEDGKKYELLEVEDTQYSNVKVVKGRLPIWFNKEKRLLITIDELDYCRLNKRKLVDTLYVSN